MTCLQICCGRGQLLHKIGRIKSLAMIFKKKKIQNFVWEAIICGYDIPQRSSQTRAHNLIARIFREFHYELGMKSFSSVDHPQTKGQVEAINKIIKHSLKAKLKEHKRVWADEIPKVLWAYRTTSRTSTRETPFSLAYDVKAMILMEVSIPSLWRETYDLEENHALQ